MRTQSLFVLLILFLAGCDALNPVPPTMTPTRSFSAPTLAPSPTLRVQNSDELFGAANPGQNDLTAASLPNEANLPPALSGTREPGGGEVVQMVMSDGVILYGDLHSVPERGRVPGVLLLATDRLSWGILAEQIRGAGYTALAMELRDPLRADDIDIMLTSFSEQGLVDPARVAVIGGGVGADAALMGCSVNPLCDAVVLLSPLSRDTLLSVVTRYNPRPMMVVANRMDANSYPTSLALIQAATGRTEFVEVDNGQGTGMLQFQPELSETIIDWLRGQFSS